MAVDPITGAAIGGAIGEFGGGLLGSFFGDDDRRRQREAIEAALRDIEATNFETGPSAMEGVTTDPRLRNAQMVSLDRLMREGEAGGMGVESRAAYAEAANETARRARSAREAVLQNMAARGQAGQGAELAAQLSAEQGAATMNNAAGTKAAADARRRALEAMAQGGSLAGGIRGQEFGEGAAKAGAEDAINKFNASARATRAGMLANTRMGVANAYGASADRAEGMGAGLGSAAGTGIGYLMGEDPRKKKGA